MWVGILLSLRQELMVTVIIFLLLFVKVGATEYKTEVVLNWVNALLLANFALGFFPVSDATLFSGMFHSGKLIVLEKNILNLISPLLGFLICAFIWSQLSGPALKLGAVWMAVGIAYGAVRTRGFQSELVNFDIPSDES